MPSTEQQANTMAVRRQDAAVLSMYELADGRALWVGTEADRTRTFIFCPDADEEIGALD